MIIERLPVGPLQANCYIVGCDSTRHAMVVDPGAEPDVILGKIAELGLKAVAIVNTHGHGDHIAANDAVCMETGATVHIHTEDAPMLGDQAKNLSGMIGKGFSCRPAGKTVVDGDVITVGKMSVTVIHTPGHTKGGICLLCEDALFSGDTLFELSVGRHDLPGGSAPDLERSIKTRLFVLPDDTRVFPGHGGATTIGREKQRNPFVGACARFRLV